MQDTDSTQLRPLLGPDEGPVVEVLNRRGGAPLVLVCEHASNFIPARLANLGLTPAAIQSHAAWDPGALPLAIGLSAALDAPLVVSGVSRLVYDCNRAPDAPGAMLDISEVYEVPGNRSLSKAERAQRLDEIYAPFRDLLRDVLDAREHAAALVTVHSFTPVYNGVRREVELGLLHDSDDRLARAMLGAAPAHTGMTTRLNQPYSALDGVMHTLVEHALPRAMLNVMLELRNDLLADQAAVEVVTIELAGLIRAGLSACGLAADVTQSERQGQ